MGHLFEGNYDTSCGIYQIFGIKKSETLQNSQRYMEISILICDVIREGRGCERRRRMALTYWLVFSLPEKQELKMIEIEICDVYLS